jgi:hypothetical protein
MKLKRLFMVGAILATMFATASALTGDANDDNQVDISDVNAVINMMLGKTEMVANCDVNGDGVIDISDVNAVINLMLGKGGDEIIGIREGSATQLFEVELKSLYEELDANAIHPTVAAMGDYVVVCLGDGRTPVYVNKATGEKVGEIALGEAEPTGCVSSDENGNLVIANFADGQGGNFCLWKTADVTAEPVKILEAPNAWGITLGDYVQVIGNLDEDAVIVATFGGLYSQHIARWIVTGGEVNPEPQVVEVGGSSVQQIWSRDNNFNVSQRTSDPADGYFMGQYASGVDNFYFIDGATNQIAGTLLPPPGDMSGWKYANCYTCTFNKVNYTVLFSIGFWPNWGLPGALYLFNTDTVDYFDGVNTVATAPGLVATCPVGDADFDVTPYAADGRVADVKLTPTKDGKYLDLVYTSNTHLMVGCVEFDCVAQ